MPHKDFEPKTGRIQNKPGAKGQRYINRVIRQMRRYGAPRSRKGRSSFSGSISGRGYTAAKVQCIRSFQPGRRRVVVKARVGTY